MSHQPRTIQHGLDARKALLTGAEKLVKAVAATYGPGGRTVLLDRFAGLLATKDGVTVAREVELEAHDENCGAHIVREACVKVNDEVGDGTTTAAILTGALLREGHKLITAGVEPGQLVFRMRNAAAAAKATIRQMVIPVESQEHLEQVALIACNGDEDVARNLAEACMAVGKDGTVLIEDSPSVETVLDFKEGMELETGPAIPYFLDGKAERVVEGALVAVINKPLTGVEDVQEVMECASQCPQNELVILAPRIESTALATLVMNHTKGVVRCCAVQVPGVPHVQKDLLEDIAVLSGSFFVDPEAGHSPDSWDSEWFGSFRKVTLTAKGVVFESYPTYRDNVQERVERLRKQADSATSGYDEDRLRERMAKLSGGLALLRVGGVTEAALKERRARVEDALGAVRAALQEGLVPGGGVAYLRAAELLSLDDTLRVLNASERAGWKAVEKALNQPVRTLAHNAGGSALTRNRIAEGEKPGFGDEPWYGWDARSGEFRNLSESPFVADPTAVVCSVIDAAVSVATTLLTVEASVTLGAA